MNYDEAISYIHSLERFGSRPGLDRISDLLKMLGDPHKKIKCVHIAGTNGKGSVSAMISSALMESGFKTGLFVSPFVIDFRERIQINGEFIKKSDLAELIDRVRSLADGMADHPTEFELVTAVMFCWFAQQKVDYAVLETGLGGRLDSTNVVIPEVSVITKISLDHTRVLGDTVEQIAAEKAGIIKAGVPVVLAPEQPAGALKVIRDTAQRLNAPLYETDCSRQFELGLKGRHQQQNAAAAFKALQLLGLSEDKILSGLYKAYMPARLETLCKDPEVILDGAHNPDGAAALAEYIGGKKPVAVMGMMRDKDTEKIMSTIAPLCRAVVAVTVDGQPRSADARTICDLASKYCDAYEADSYVSALETADRIRDKNPIVICGSLFLASGIRDIAIKRYNTTTK